MNAVEELIRSVPGASAACRALGVSRASFYRRRRRTPTIQRPRSPRALSAPERREVLEVLHSERFADASPAAIYAVLLDEGRYICSVRSFYRILAENHEVRERRDQRRHPVYVRPERVATGPNQVWSWDITKLMGPGKWDVYSLYVLLDIFSRYVVGWMVATRESANLAARLIREACERQGIEANRLTIHSDRGAPMTSKTVEMLLLDMGIVRSLSRPRVSDDNPYSEAHFKTMKYRPEFPDRFGSLEDARGFCRRFFPWYVDEHRHSGIGYMTPAAVHFGRAPAITARRRVTLAGAYAAHPERFVRTPPAPPALPTEVWINEPKTIDLESEVTQ